uniref:Nodulin-26 n=1 Tax=Glycine max TaxID=3847 RepID=A0A0R0IKM3_SOYBN
MADYSAGTESQEVVVNVTKNTSETIQRSDSLVSVPFLQKLVAEAVGTYFLIFAGCASLVVNENYYNMITFPGIAIVWGLVLTVLVYTVGHISGGHFNPAVTIAFASTRRFPLIQVPAYVVAQLLGSILASGTLRLLFMGNHDQFSGTVPNGTNLQAFVFEFIMTFFLMFVICGVATDNRAVTSLTFLPLLKLVLCY